MYDALVIIKKFKFKLITSLSIWLESVWSWTSFINQVFTPACLRVRVDDGGAKWTLACTCRLRFKAVMAWVVVFKQNSHAFHAFTILFSILTLFNKMLVQSWNFDNLLTLPTSCQQRTFFPVMNINRLLVKVFIVTSTEIANLFVTIIFINRIINIACKHIVTNYRLSDPIIHFLACFFILLLRTILFLLNWSFLGFF